MKRIILIVFLINYGCTMTKPELAKEISWQVLHVIDTGQTISASNQPEKYEELNPLLGNHPSKKKIYSWAIINALLHAAISKNLSKENRKVWQNITLGFKIGVTTNNASIGVGVRF